MQGGHNLNKMIETGSEAGSNLDDSLDLQKLEKWHLELDNYHEGDLHATDIVMPNQLYRLKAELPDDNLQLRLRTPREYEYREEDSREHDFDDFDL